MRNPFIAIILIVIALGGLLFQATQANGTYDDAFITYRYSYNVLMGNGLVYNVGEHVLGTTTPGYALVLAAVSAPFGAENIPYVSRALNYALMVGLMAAAAWGAFAIFGRRWLVAAALALLVASNPMTVRVMNGGMEQILFLFTLVLSFSALLHRRYLLAAVLAGWMVWIRPEGVFWIGLLGLQTLWLRYRKDVTTRRSGLMLAALVLPNLLYAGLLTLFYGSPIPQSVSAKAAGLYDLPSFSGASFVLLQLSQPWTSAFSAADDLSLLVFFAAIIVNGVFFLFGLRHLLRLHPHLWTGAGYTLIAIGFYFSSSAVFAWYHGLYVLPFIWIVWAGGYHFISAVLRRNKRLQQMSIAGGMIAAIVISSYVVQVREWPADPTHDLFLFDRERAYYEALDMLQDRIPPDASIAMPEIGVLGFYLPQNRVIDTAGLVTPQAVAYFPIPRTDLLGGIAPDLVRDLKPDYIVTLRGFIEFTGARPETASRGGDLDETFAEQADLQAQYAVISEVPVMAFGEEMILQVYERQAEEAG